MEIAEFLLARIAEVEVVARQAKQDWYSVEGGLRYGDCGYNTSPDLTIDPDHLLAECEAKRRIIRDYQHDVRDYRAGYTNVQPSHKTMKHLALPYADHPDCNSEWKL